MNQSLRSYHENLEKIIYRDYMKKTKESKKRVEGLLSEGLVKEYLDRGYTEEAAANEIFEIIQKLNL